MKSRQIILQDIIPIDTISGAISKPTNILLENGFIKKIGGIEIDTHNDIFQINCKNRYLLPGLFDCHTHLSALMGRENKIKSEILKDAEIENLADNSELAEIILNNFTARGITQVRDCGGPLNILKKLRDKISNGTIVGPDLFYAGPMLEKSPLTAAGMNNKWPGWTVAIDSKNDVKNVINELLTNGASFVKIFGKSDTKVLKYLLQEAKNHNLPVTIDPGITFFHDIPIDVGIDLGINCFEHSKSFWKAILKDEIKTEYLNLLKADPEDKQNFISRIWSMGEESISLEKLDYIIERIIENNAYVCPTLQITKFYAEKPGVFNDKEPEKYGPIFKRLYEIGCLISTEIIKSNVRIMVGQDGYIPRFTYEEMKLLKNNGLTEIEIIRGATIYPSEWLNVEDRYGSIEIGKIANLIILNKNPLENIENMESVHMVLKQGNIVYQGQ